MTKTTIMEVSLSVTFWKYALLTFNILISLAAVVLISCGVVALGCAGSVSGAYIVTGIGSLVLINCFIGCFASLRESHLLALLFVGMGAVCIVLQTIYMISFITMKDTLMKDTANRVESAWEDVWIYPKKMYNLQSQYYCCGKDSPQDYIIDDDDDELPDTCCSLNDCSKPANIFTKGCATTIVTFFDDQSDNLILTFVGLTFVTALGMASSYFFSRNLKPHARKPEQIFITEE